MNVGFRFKLAGGYQKTLKKYSPNEEFIITVSKDLTQAMINGKHYMTNFKNIITDPIQIEGAPNKTIMRTKVVEVPGTSIIYITDFSSDGGKKYYNLSLLHAGVKYNFDGIDKTFSTGSVPSLDRDRVLIDAKGIHQYQPTGSKVIRNSFGLTSAQMAGFKSDPMKRSMIKSEMDSRRATYQGIKLKNPKDFYSNLGS